MNVQELLQFVLVWGSGPVLGQYSYYCDIIHTLDYVLSHSVSKITSKCHNAKIHYASGQDQRVRGDSLLLVRFQSILLDSNVMRDSRKPARLSAMVVAELLLSSSEF